MNNRIDVNIIETKLRENKEYIKKVFYVKEIGILGLFVRGE
jgi:predicted nucleotidyltransferase